MKALNEKMMERLVKDRKKTALLIRKTLASSRGGPPCKRCLASWRLNLIINEKKREIKRLQVSNKILLENHPKCSACGILFGDCHLEAPTRVPDTGKNLCSVCFGRYSRSLKKEG